MTPPASLSETEKLLLKATREVHDFKTALDEHAIVAITDPRGKITYVNEKFCAISQYNEEELIGQDHRILNSSHHPKAFFQELWQTIQSGEVWRGEIRNRRKDGSYYWVDTTIVPFVDSEGRPVQHIAIRADITERKLYEEELAKLAAELDSKNKELETVIYAASHDLRSPLVNVQGFASVIGEEMADLKKLVQACANGETPELSQVQAIEGEIERALDFIVAGTTKMDALLGGLLVISRLGQLEVRDEAVDVARVAEMNLSAMRYQLEEAGATVLVEDLPMARGDADLLGQVFGNLFGNAIKYSSKERSLVLKVRGKDFGDKVRYEVSDNGIGISKQHQDRIFNLFHRLNPTDTEGHGVGLAIVKRALDRMNGTVEVDSEPGRGTTFSIVLPKSAV
ncbi:ATP-binding protein [Roseibacillus persicicus]|uniref:sensor histidine kinase n=1 Tax=Roseibacillus persicicus TaxID=454148 RepID=UPI00398A8521